MFVKDCVVVEDIIQQSIKKNTVASSCPRHLWDVECWAVRLREEAGAVTSDQRFVHCPENLLSRQWRVSDVLQVKQKN